MKKLIVLIVAVKISITVALSQSTLNFQNLTPMHLARGAVTTASDGNYFYVSNGFSAENKFTELIEKYDVVNNNWTVLSSSIIPKQFASSAIVGNELYIFNGDLADGTLNKKMEVVNVETGDIRFSTDNPQPAHAAGVAAWNGIIYFFGGNISNDQPQYSNKLFKFDPVTEKWTELSSMPGKMETKGIVVDGKIYVIGGYNGNASLKIFMYDIATDKWTKLLKLSNRISANSIIAYGSKIYTFFDFTNQDFIGCYDIPTNKFTVIQQTNMIGRRHAGAHLIKDKVYIMGGNTSSEMRSCLSSLQAADLK